MTGKMTGRRIELTLILMGFFGVVLFFPLKLENGETCLAQHYVHGKGEHTGGNPMLAHGHSLAQYYVYHYGLLWWGSIGLSAAGFSFLRKKKQLLEDMNMRQDAKREEDMNVRQDVKREEESTITELGKERVM